MPDPRPEPAPIDASLGADARTAEQRANDHAVIAQLAERLLPAIAAKLAATGLAEIELREGTWKIRVSRPPGGPNVGRRATDRPSRTQPGHAGHGHAPAALEGHRGARLPMGYSGNGTGPGTPVAVGPSPVADGEPGRRGDADPYRVVATSPAVGIFRLRAEMTPGTRVRAGDALGAVDMLGVPQEVVAPADGIVGPSLAQTGEAVEYGQDLVVIELATSPAGGS